MDEPVSQPAQLSNVNTGMTLFENFLIRRVWFEMNWWYSIIDMLAAITHSPNPRRYWADLKRDMLEHEGIDVYDTIGIQQVPMPDRVGARRRTDCGTHEMLLRLVQSVKSPNAEPFKQWLAQVGAAAMEEPTEREQRIQYRKLLHRYEAGLMQLVIMRGMISEAQHQDLLNHRLNGLYNVTGGEIEVLRLKGLHFPGEIPDGIGSEELATWIFTVAQTQARITDHNLVEQFDINQAALNVAQTIRGVLQNLGRPMPEDLPRMKLLNPGEWWDDNDPRRIKWEDSNDEQAVAE